MTIVRVLLCVALVIITGSAHLGTTIQEYAGVIIDLHRHYGENACVFLITSGQDSLTNHRQITDLLKQLSHLGVAGMHLDVGAIHRTDLLCSGSRPLNVLLSEDQETHNALVLLDKVPSYPRWLMFVEIAPEKYFAHVYVPFNCEFLLAERHSGVTTEPLFLLHEMYRVDEHAPLTLNYFGEWSFQLGFSVTKHSLRMRRNSLQGLKLKAAAKPWWPGVTIAPGPNHTSALGGFLGEIWTSLEEKTNFTTEIHSIEGVRNLLLPNGSWTGVFAMIEKQEVQVCINDFSLSVYRMDVVDYLFPLYISYQRVFVQSRPSINLKWNNFLSPFALHLWLCIVGFILSVGAILFAVEHVGQRCHVRNEPAARGLVDSIFFVHGFFCQQGPETTPRSMSGRIVHTIGALTSVVIIAAYSAVLVSFVSVQTPVFPINNLNDMMSDGRYKLGIIGGSGFYTDVLEKSSEPFTQSVYSQLIFPDKENLPKNDGEGFSRICADKHYAYMTAYETSVGYWDNQPCAISPLPSVAIPRQNAMMIAKDSPYKELINFFLLSLRQTGALQRSYLLFWSRIHHTHDDSFKSVTLNQMIPIFTVCVSGYVFGILVLVVEIYVNKCRSPLASINRKPGLNPRTRRVTQ